MELSEQGTVVPKYHKEITDSATIGGTTISVEVNIDIETSLAHFAKMDNQRKSFYSCGRRHELDVKFMLLGVI